MKGIEEFLSEYYINDEKTIEKTIMEESAEVEDDVLREDAQKDSKYFFKNILIFTNERDPKKNKTLDNLNEAIKDMNIKLYVFVAEEVTYKFNNNGFHIEDEKTKIDIDKFSNVDTIAITRLGAQDSNECVECIKELQDWGVFVINPIQYAQKASNKYSTSVLLDKYNIPQPKFALLDASDINSEESLGAKLKLIYDEFGQDKEADKRLEYVLKILDGHGGTGVCMVTGKEILSILQMVFAIDPDRELLLQKKEEGDGGDIRVHVLTMRTEQKILACMKRQQLKGDFRSNVSLGAQAVKVVLTEEQKQIALKVAKISGMPWCAVDIMPLVKGSNPEIGDNVVLEYNASPGTDGISEVIGKNFMEILLDAINNINELTLSPKSIGYIENIKIHLKDINGDPDVVLSCKMDTGNGAKASTIGCDKIDVDGDDIIATIEGKKYTFKRHGQSLPTVGQVKETRETVLIPCIQIGTRKLLDVEFALVDNRNKSTKVLLNRDILSKMAYNINAGKKYTLEEDSEMKNKY